MKYFKPDKVLKKQMVNGPISLINNPRKQNNEKESSAVFY